MTKITTLLDAAKEEDQHFTFEDSRTANAFRARLYKYMRRWKNHNPSLYAEYEDIKIMKDKANPATIIITTHSRRFDDVLAPYANIHTK